MSANDFARALDRCIERSNRAKLIELRAEPQLVTKSSGAN
jgi:hypothetical protein